jgi:ATP-dependent Clp protease protease subunit
MAKRKLHEMPELDAARRDMIQFAEPACVMQRFDGALQAAEGAADNTVDVMGVIGWPEWAGGVEASQVAAKLKAIGDGDVIVNINSPGGDFFEGQAIHNLLRMHPGQVEVRVVGIAASAASVIAMAGDKIVIPKAGWMMIHNVWTIAMGDKNVLASIIGDLEKFDMVSADLYAERSGHPFREIVKMMDAETMLSGAEAVDKGFADELLAADKVKSGAKQAATTSAKQLLMTAAQKGGLSRAGARAAFAQLKIGTPRAADPGKPRAADTAGLSAGLLQLRTALADLGDVHKG